MKALIVEKPGVARVIDVREPSPDGDGVLLEIRRVGLCGTDLNTFCGRNPLVTFPRVLGHEVSATVLEDSVAAGEAGVKAGDDVTLSPYTACGRCASCRHGRPNACEFNETLAYNATALSLNDSSTRRKSCIAAISAWKSYALWNLLPWDSTPWLVEGLPLLIRLPSLAAVVWGLAQSPEQAFAARG